MMPNIIKRSQKIKKLLKIAKSKKQIAKKQKQLQKVKI